MAHNEYIYYTIVLGQADMPRAAVSADSKTRRKIWSFKDLKAGWHFGEGEQFSSNRLRQAVKLIDLLTENGFSETDAFPGIAGEIRVTAYDGNCYGEFTLETDNLWSALGEQGGEIVSSLEGVGFDELKKLVRFFAVTICNISDCSRSSSTGIDVSKDLPVWLSDRQGTVEFLYSKENVPSQSLTVSVTTPENSILV